MHRSSVFRLALAALVILSGCSTFENLWLPTQDVAAPARVSAPVEAPEVSGTAAVEAQKLPEQTASLQRRAPSRKPKVVPAVEISWQVPVGTVQFYYLDYGYSPTALDHRVKIKVSTLEKVDHPVHGPIFRYELKGVRPMGPIYYSLRAENAGKLSPPTPVQKLEQ